MFKVVPVATVSVAFEFSFKFLTVVSPDVLIVFPPLISRVILLISEANLTGRVFSPFATTFVISLANVALPVNAL